MRRTMLMLCLSAIWSIMVHRLEGTSRTATTISIGLELIKIKMFKQFSSTRRLVVCSVLLPYPRPNSYIPKISFTKGYHDNDEDEED